MPKGEHNFTLIMMHGLGNSALGCFPIFADQGETRITPLDCKIILPTAPVAVLTYNGVSTNSWFDFLRFEFDVTKESPENANEKVWEQISQEEIISRADEMLKIVDREAKLLGDDPSKVYIGGLSQGCMVSLAVFLKYRGEKPLGGIIGIMGMIALDYTRHIKFENDEEKDRIVKLRRDTPMFLYHGEDD